MDITKTDAAPEITDEDIKLLLDNFHNIDIWKEKFPPNSYILKGFGLMNLFDVTQDQTISEIRSDLLKKDDGSIVQKLRLSLSEFYRISDLKLGFSLFEIANQSLESTRIKKSESLILDNEQMVSCETFFCSHIIDKVFNKIEPVAISNVDAYGESSNHNTFL